MNLLLFGIIGTSVVVLLTTMAYQLLKRVECVQRIVTKLSYKIFFNALHAGIDNACVPLQVAAFFSLYACAKYDQDLTSMAVPIMMILGFLLYPVVSYMYMMKHSDELLSFDESNPLYLRHKAYFSNYKVSPTNLRSNQRLIMVFHYRKLLFSFMIVWME